MKTNSSSWKIQVTSNLDLCFTGKIFFFSVSLLTEVSSLDLLAVKSFCDSNSLQSHCCGQPCCRFFAMEAEAALLRLLGQCIEQHGCVV